MQFSDKLRILVFSKRPFHNSPRIIREIDALKNDFNVFAIGETRPIDESISFENIYNLRTFSDKVFYKLNSILKRKDNREMIIPNFSRLEKYIIKNDISLVIIHEPIFLPLALKLKDKIGIKVVFNAHEYHPLEFEDQKGWLESVGVLYDNLYRRYLSKLDLLVNVCEGISEKCFREYNVSSLVIPNAAFFSSTPIFVNSNDEKIKLIYHGAILESRKIEEMIKLAQLLGDSYSFDIMGTSTEYNNVYYKKLLDKIVNVSNVSFKEPVLFNEIISVINKYDIGVYILNPNGFNNEYALPNKVFEYIQAKLAIAISPSKEMRKIVEKYDLGVVADDFSPENLARKIRKLSKQDILNFKKNSEKASKVENAEKYKELYLSNIKALLN